MRELDDGHQQYESRDQFVASARAQIPTNQEFRAFALEFLLGPDSLFPPASPLVKEVEKAVAGSAPFTGWTDQVDRQQAARRLVCWVEVNQSAWGTVFS